MRPALFRGEEQLPQAHPRQQQPKEPAQQGAFHPLGQQGPGHAGGQAPQDGGAQSPAVHQAPAPMAPKGRQGAQEKVQQVHPAGLGLGHALYLGEPQQEQGPAAHSQAGEDPGGQADEHGEQPAHGKNRARTPPASSSPPKARRSSRGEAFPSRRPARTPPRKPPAP